MTKKERKLIQKAMWYIHTGEEDGGDYNTGMDILCDLLNADRKARRNLTSRSSRPHKNITA